MNKVLAENFPRATARISYEAVREEKQLNIAEVVKFGDAFLANTFGPSFRPKVLGVSLLTKRVKDGEIWCWAILYQHPDGGELDGRRIFRIYLSSQGEPLMKVHVKGGDKITPTDNSRSAPRQPPEGPLPAKPGSAPK